MIIKRSVEHRVRMGDYESVVTSVAIEADIDDLPVGDYQRRIDFVNDLLDRALAADLRELRDTADDSSYVMNWRK